MYALPVPHHLHRTTLVMIQYRQNNTRSIYLTSQHLFDVPCSSRRRELVHYLESRLLVRVEPIHVGTALVDKQTNSQASINHVQL